jgi:RES domain-containing protein
MSLWRISRHQELEGLGGEKSDGRWHTARKGKRIVYLSEHPAVALLEVLANLRGDPRLFPDTYQLLKIDIDPDAFASAASIPNLPESWRDDLTLTRREGDLWLANGRSALLAVPSAPSPESLNYLLNPKHLDAQKLHIEWTKWIQHDKRLFHLTSIPGR